MNTPNLAKIALMKDKVRDWNRHPFSVPTIRNFDELNFDQQVTFFVGENGTGKSTFLEAIANHVGFGAEGGSRNIYHKTTDENAAQLLSDALRFSWKKKLFKGYFLRSESFFNIATYIDQLQKENPSDPVWQAYGGKSLHQQSHGEAFLSLFQYQLAKGGIYLLDEPEAALSPQRQLSLLVILNDVISSNKDTQVIIATHSPILLAFPDAQILSFDDEEIAEVAYEHTQPYLITKGFLNHPEQYLNQLFASS